MAKPSPLLKRLHAQRERYVAVPDDEGDEERIKYLLRRVTFLKHVQMVERARAGEIGPREILSEWVKGWQGMRENDITPSGSDDDAEFDLEVALDWAEDRLLVQTKLLDATKQMMEEFTSSRKELQGNS